MTNSGPIVVAPGNIGAEVAWNGPDGDHWAVHADAFDDSMAHYREAFLDATRINVSDRVLDIGCGNGRSTLDAALLARHAFALGVDLSAAMLAVARRRAGEQHVTNVGFLRADAQVHPFEAASFDVAMSHAGATFFADPVAAFANVARALRPGAPLTLLVWQAFVDNDWLRELSTILSPGHTAPAASGAPGPFALADPARARCLLEAGGFTDIAVHGQHKPIDLGPTVEQACEWTTGLGVFRALLLDLDVAARDAALDRLRRSLSAHLTADGVHYPSAMWIIAATRS